MADDQVVENLTRFYEYVWGDEPGQAYVATLSKGGSFQQYMVEWPRMKKKIVEFTLAQSAEGKDFHYCPSLFVEKKDTVEFSAKNTTAATRANIKGSFMLWADFDDGSAPTDWEAFAKEKGIPKPTMSIQSSVKGNEHDYWRTDFNNSVDEIEQSNRTIALACGADRSGWDANQLLRPPYTRNYGYRGDGSHKSWYKGEPATVQFSAGVSDTRVSKDDFGSLGSPEREAFDRLSIGTDIPGVAEVLAFGNWTKELYDQFHMTQDEASASSPNKRSGALMRLTYMAAEAGFTDEYIYAILDDADTRWDKYVRRSPSSRKKILLDTIATARAKVGYIRPEDLKFTGLLGGTETEGEAPKLAYSWGEFMEADVSIDWLIEGLLPGKGVGIITGQPGTGKTQLGLQIAIALALGKPDILGWNNIGGPKKVMILSLEMGKETLRFFSDSIDPMYSDHRREMSKNITVVPRGKDLPFDKQDGYAFMDMLMSEYKPDVVFVDSMQKISSKPLTDEMGAKDLMTAIEGLREKHQAAFYIIHHDRKKSQDAAKNGPGVLSDMYGNIYISANVDFVLSLRSTPTIGSLVLDSWKTRLGPQAQPKSLIRNKFLQYNYMKDLEDGDEGIRIIESLRGEDGNPQQRGSTLSI